MADSRHEAHADRVRVHDTSGPEGLVLVAARNFAPGDVVLEEHPDLSWPKDDPSKLVSAFLAASSVAQASILAMSSSAVGGPERAQGRTDLAKELAKVYQGPRVVELIQALLSISDTNAHSLGSDMGLFATASKANHSCNPNCGHSTRVGGVMRYYAFRTISEGQEITISYLSDLWSTSRKARRATLLSKKGFICGCLRCSGSEFIRDAQAGGSSAPAAAQAFASLECTAAECNSRGCVAAVAHPPCPSLVAPAVTAFLALCAHASPESRAAAATISARYLPWATLHFGSQDVAVLAMQAVQKGARAAAPSTTASGLEKSGRPSAAAEEPAAATDPAGPGAAGMAEVGPGAAG
eukprot:CAMPEP_0185472878 /NCGR_PEP_ID=MMETSP1366-20130426/1100_1 /TAXON_ID=38817 /ORGANISM="Gephyrocapsa oceanica, Strain RCC1303" /LENGTH=352 /DNA_ID=CAMNT_0028079701 /DNA_START=20 /DNA_END=1075 /DNA_ORIENTATION=+